MLPILAKLLLLLAVLVVSCNNAPVIPPATTEDTTTDVPPRLGDPAPDTSIPSTGSDSPDSTESEYTVVIDIIGMGSVSVEPPGGTYAPGTALRLSATPLSNWRFGHWDGDINSSLAVQDILVNEDLSLTAVFVQSQPDGYALAVTVEGEGAVTVDPPGEIFPSGTSVLLTGIPETSSTFTGWRGPTSTRFRSARVTMDSDVAITARFEVDPQCNYIMPPIQAFAQASDPYIGSDGNSYVRYRIAIANHLAIPDQLFGPAPDLPPCGLNLSASRSWVDIFSASGDRLYGFCALASPADLTRLWFAVPFGQQPPDQVQVAIVDRACSQTYLSAATSTYPTADSLPDLVAVALDAPAMYTPNVIPESGALVRFVETIRNEGAVDVAWGVGRAIYISEDDGLSSDDAVHLGHTVYDLAAGETQSFGFTLYLHNRRSVFAFLVVDPLDDLLELDESNNVLRVGPILPTETSASPNISSTAPSTATVGVDYTYAVNVTGTPIPTLQVSGLPAWLTFEPGSRTISGAPTPMDVGVTDPITVLASNSVGPDAVESFQITVLAAPESPKIISMAPTNATVGIIYEYAIAATGVPAPIISVSGLPLWLSFDPDTGTIRGTPSPGDLGVSESITVSASNGVTPDAADLFRIVVYPAPESPTITSTAPSTATVGVDYTYAVNVTGTPIPTLQVSGLPAWLTFEPGSRTISGAPTPMDVGVTDPITILASNSAGPDAEESFQITVLAAPESPKIISMAPTNATVGIIYEYAIAATGVPAPIISVSGLPLWLSFDPDTGTIRGTPSPGDLGVSESITVSASNGVTPDAADLFRIVVYPAPESPTITSTAPATATVGVDYTYAVNVTGTPIPTLQVSGLPAWLTFEPGSRTISGAPTPMDVGVTDPITVLASNSVGPDAVESFQITVLAAPESPKIISMAPTNATVGIIYEYAIAATGVPAPIISVSGLPLWLSFDPDTGTIRGTPSPGDLGVSESITVSASNGVTPDAQEAFDVYVQASQDRAATIFADRAFIGVGESIDLRVETVGLVPPYSVAWDLDGDGIFERNGAMSLSWAFDTPGDHVVGARVAGTYDSIETQRAISVIDDSDPRFVEFYAVKLDGGIVSERDTGAVYGLAGGDRIDVRVLLRSHVNLDPVEVSLDSRAFTASDRRQSELIRISAGTIRAVGFSARVQSGISGANWVRISVAGRNTPEVSFVFMLDVAGVARSALRYDSVEINGQAIQLPPSDILLSPGDSVCLMGTAEAGGDVLASNLFTGESLPIAVGPTGRFRHYFTVPADARPSVVAWRSEDDTVQMMFNVVNEPMAVLVNEVRIRNATNEVLRGGISVELSDNVLVDPPSVAMEGIEVDVASRAEIVLAKAERAYRAVNFGTNAGSCWSLLLAEGCLIHDTFDKTALVINLSSPIGPSPMVGWYWYPESDDFGMNLGGTVGGRLAGPIRVSGSGYFTVGTDGVGACTSGGILTGSVGACARVSWDALGE